MYLRFVLRLIILQGLSIDVSLSLFSLVESLPISADAFWTTLSSSIMLSVEKTAFGFSSTADFLPALVLTSSNEYLFRSFASGVDGEGTELDSHVDKRDDCCFGATEIKRCLLDLYNKATHIVFSNNNNKTMVR